MENEADKIAATISLKRFLPLEVIEDIVEMAIKTDAAKGYTGRLEMQTLLDALRSRIRNPEMFDNKFPYTGGPIIWTCPNNHQNATFNHKCISCGYINEDPDLLPHGTYELLYEEDLGAPVGTCQNYHCGHPIRYAEHIRHIESGREFVVGNVCLLNLLGKHDLLLIAVSLLSKISDRIDHHRRIKEIENMVGHILKKIHISDPLHKLTPAEGEFYKQLQKGSGTLLTMKRAQEIKNNWTDGNIEKLSTTVIDLTRAQEAATTDEQKSKKKETLSWIAFLKFKDYDNKRREIQSDFIENCLDDIEIHGSLAETRKSSLKNEKDLYDRVREADPLLLVNISSEDDRYFLAHLMNHVRTSCNSFFYISIVLSALHFKSLTVGQKNALTTRGCNCGYKIPERR
jgi:hypothetical protein